MPGPGGPNERCRGEIPSPVRRPRTAAALWRRPSYRDRTGPSRSSPPVQKCCAEMMSMSVARIQKNRCRTTIAERMVEARAELPFIGDQVVLEESRLEPLAPARKGRALRRSDRDLLSVCPANCENNGGSTSSKPARSTAESANYRYRARLPILGSDRQQRPAHRIPS